MNKKLQIFFLLLFIPIGLFSQTVDYSFVTVGCNRVDYTDTTATAGTEFSSGKSTANVYQLNRLFTEVSQLVPLPKFIFLTGDMVMGYKNDTLELAKQLTNWKLIYQNHPLSSTGITLVVIPGNHETQDKAAGKKAYVAAERTFVREMSSFILANNGPGVGGADGLTTDQSQLTYSFDYGDDHYLILNTDPVGQDSKVPFKWVAADVQNARAANARHIFAFGHKPAFSSPLKTGDGLENGFALPYIAQRDSLWKYLENNRCEAMFAAHEHLFDVVHPHTDKTWQIIAGNGGSRLETTWQDASTQSYFGFTLVTLFTNGETNIKSYGRYADCQTASDYSKDGSAYPTTIRANFNIAISPIEHSPLSNTHNNGPFAVTATINDNVAITSTQLIYWVNGIADTIKSPTTIEGSDYIFAIPVQANSGIINYKITATDAASFTFNSPANGSNNTFSYGANTVNKYVWNSPAKLGTYQDLDIMNGGFSGLQYIPGTENEFFAITDRGPNLDANTNKHAIAIGGPNNSAKLFPLPNFHPQMIRVKASGDSLTYISSTTIKQPDGTPTSGLTNSVGYGGTAELALSDTTGVLTPNDVWGIDSEGLSAGNNHDYWIPEEYGVSVWHVDSIGKVINRYAPYGGLLGSQPQDLPIDTIFKYRNANKGFEGLAFSPNGKVYAFLQNTLLYPITESNLKKNTRLHRFVEINPASNTTRMLGYEHDKVPASGQLSSIKNDKRYIGDAVAVNDQEFLILEHGKSATESYAKIYKININTATAIDPTNALAYAGGTKSFEQLLDSTTCAANGVTVVSKTLFLDLIANGYDPTIEKQEGLTIVNDSTIAIANDNDFGVISTLADGVMSLNGVKSYIYTFTVPQDKKLNLCLPLTINGVGNTTFCQGGAVMLNAPALAGGSYEWKLNDQTIANEISNTIMASESGNYSLTISANGSVANSNVITVLAKQEPIATLTLEGNTLTANVNDATYKWFNANDLKTPIVGEDAISFTPTENGSYVVEITTPNGCSASSDAVDVVATNINNNSATENQLNVYPNPSNGAFTIESFKAGNFTIVNSMGQTVASFKLSEASNYKTTIEGLSNGIYYITDGQNGDRVHQKIVVKK